MRIPKEFAPLDIHYDRDRAIRRAGNDGELMFLRSIAHVRAENTNGRIEDFDLDKLGRGMADPQVVAQRLVDVNLWVVDTDGWRLRSFAKWSPDRADRTAASLVANHERWHVKKGITSPDCSLCDPSESDRSPSESDGGNRSFDPPAKGPDSTSKEGRRNTDTTRATPGETPSRSAVIRSESDSESDRSPIRSLEVEREREREEEKKNIMSELRPDVVSLLDHLDRCIRSNGAKVPARSKANVDAARLLIDRDGRTTEEAHRLIEWCQNDEFWRTNILSMSKFRAKYDQLRLRADRTPRPAVAAGRRLSPLEQQFADLGVVPDAPTPAPPVDWPGFDIIEGELA